MNKHHICMKHEMKMGIRHFVLDENQLIFYILFYFKL